MELEYLYQNEKMKHRLVGETRLPKYELICVYPGIGHTKPLGLKSIISESRELDCEKLPMVGIKNTEIKIVIEITNMKREAKIF